MSQNIPIVDYRFGDLYYVTEFVTPRNAQIVKELSRILGGGGITNGQKDVAIRKIADYIRDEFQYPINALGQPATQCQLSNGEWIPYVPFFQSSIFRLYAWDFPSETAVIKLGFCAETANLVVSLLRGVGIEAFGALGIVYDSKTNQILGYHEWVVVEYQGVLSVIESTIHTRGAENIMTVEQLYSGQMDVRYAEVGRFNESTYVGEEIE